MAYYFTINHDKQFIAIFSPKCGCTTIKDWFNHTLAIKNPAIQRNTHKYMIPGKLIGTYPHYRKVFFVRNPFRRLVSFFCRWVIRDNTQFCYADAQKQFPLQNKSFREFLQLLRYLWSQKLEFQHHLEPQSQRLEDISFDHVVTLETFDSDIESLNKILEIDYVHKRMNVTPYNTRIQEYVFDRPPKWFRRVGIPSCEFFYNEELIDLVCRIFEHDVAFYYKHYPVVQDDFDKRLIQRMGYLYEKTTTALG